jgi:hypothetical protein
MQAKLRNRRAVAEDIGNSAKTRIAGGYTG